MDTYTSGESINDTTITTPQEGNEWVICEDGDDCTDYLNEVQS